MKVYDSVLELIGKTPIVKISSLNDGFANIFAKVEYFNPAGSIKDRAALSMIEQAENQGIITPNKSVIIEPTSGNTGIGFALVCLKKGYRLILTMPESMSKERRDILSAYGAELVLTPACDGMKGSILKAEELSNEIENSFIPQQFSNPLNVLSHYNTTGPEIWKDMDRKVDIFVSTIGTGGTISGCAKFLKEKKSDVKIVGVEPSSSPMISKGESSPHKIQGIGANFVPDNYYPELVDEIITICDDDAISFAKKLALKEGLFCGISSGAAIKAALELSNRKENRDKNIVVILPDTGMRYLSSEMFQ